MKKLIIKICRIALCIVPLFSLAACLEKTSTDSSSSNSWVSEEPSPIKDLRNAIKQNPTEYNNKRVSVKGTILKEDGKTILLDYHYKIDSSATGSITGDDIQHSVAQRNQAKKKPSIEVILLDNVQSYVVESWDYVELTGTVKITDNGIYLDNCQCTVL